MEEVHRMLSDFYVDIETYKLVPIIDDWGNESTDEADWTFDRVIQGLVEPLSNNNKEWNNDRDEYVNNYILYTGDKLNNQNRIKWNGELYSITSIADIMHLSNNPHYEIFLQSINEYSEDV